MKEAIIPQRPSWRFSEAYRKKAEEIRLRVRDKYAVEYAKASLWDKLKIKVKIAREISKEMKALDPSHWL